MILKTLMLAATLLTLTSRLAAQDLAPEFVVHINEPFLTFETNGDSVRIISPDDLAGTTVPVERLEVAGVVQVVGEHQGERFVVTIMEDACADDIVGLPYSHSAAVAFGDTLKDGCARRSTEPQPREGG